MKGPSALGLHKGRLSPQGLRHEWFIGLNPHLRCFLTHVLHQALEFGLELDLWVPGELLVVAFEPFFAVFGFEGSDDISEIFVFSEEALILAPALYGGPGEDELGHLFEDFAGAA
jgi:hypothetical protein